MNKHWVLSCILVTVFLVGCVRTQQTSGESGVQSPSTDDAARSLAAEASSTSIESVKGTVWQLIEVRLPDNALSIDRSALAKNNFENYYTLQFTDDGITGKAAPNTYFAPYKSSHGNSIALFLMRNTLMAQDITVVEGLSERDYCSYIQNISHWDKTDDNLRLYAKTESGADVILSYTQALPPKFGI
jgi:heat shock protein HslJ